MQTHSHKIPTILLATYAILFIGLAIDPYNRDIWWVENIPVLIITSILVLTYAYFKFSNFSYFLMTLFLCYHTIGGYFSFELVPFDWGNKLLSELNVDFIFPEHRNNFDRLGHFLVGVFAYPLIEISLLKKWMSSKTTTFFFVIFFIGFCAASYEIIEMTYMIIDSESGSMFIGNQGDIWDVQKNMLLDIVGGCVFGLLALLTTQFKNSLK